MLIAQVLQSAAESDQSTFDMFPQPNKHVSTQVHAAVEG